jgi:hypothetical protein
MKNLIDKLRNVSLCDECEDEMSEAIDELDEKISSPDSIVEWFKSPFISDFDKRKALEEINKLTIS